MHDAPDPAAAPIAYPGGSAAGLAAIRAALKTMPPTPGVYRMLDRQGRCALCRQGAQPEEPGAELHARGRAVEPAAANGRRDRDHGHRRHPDRGRGAAARMQSDQAPDAALQRPVARRQIVSADPDRRRSRIPATHQASRRARQEGQLFRPVRLGRRGQPHARDVAEGVPVALVQRQHVRGAAPAPASCTRSSGAARPASAASAARTMPP